MFFRNPSSGNHACLEALAHASANLCASMRIRVAVRVEASTRIETGKSTQVVGAEGGIPIFNEEVPFTSYFEVQMPA